MKPEPNKLDAPSGVAVERVVGRRWTVRPIFRVKAIWRHLIVGVLYSPQLRTLYIMPFPCIGVAIEFDRTKQSVDIHLEKIANIEKYGTRKTPNGKLTALPDDQNKPPTT